jgi:hypothetical protein
MEKAMTITRRAVAFLGLGALALAGCVSPIALVSFPNLPADAAPPPNVFKDASGNVIVHSGVTPGQKLLVELTGTPYKKNEKVGACGQIVLKTSTSMPTLGNSVTVNGTTIDLTTLPAGTAPKCTNGTWAGTAPTANFKETTSSGAIKVYLVGYTANGSQQVLFPDLPAHFNATVNGCGFANIKSTSAHTIGTSLKIAGTSYDISSLPTADTPLCRKTASGSQLYTPGSWGQ